jgi:hypothetical protein
VVGTAIMKIYHVRVRSDVILYMAQIISTGPDFENEHITIQHAVALYVGISKGLIALMQPCIAMIMNHVKSRMNFLSVTLLLIAVRDVFHDEKRGKKSIHSVLVYLYKLALGLRLKQRVHSDGFNVLPICM